jgi:DNA-binding winged helix-turn-helix (wHTH) protein
MLYRFDECELDDRLYQLRRQGERVEIKPKAFDLLVYLLHQREQVVSKDELLDKVWPGTVVSEAALTRCIARERSEMTEDSSGSSKPSTGAATDLSPPSWLLPLQFQVKKK